MADYAYSITNILNQWAEFGVFAYLLPFLMIFAVIYGLLNKTKLLGENKGVQATVALTVGLLSLQFDYVSRFFAVIFPYTGMGIAVLLIALILLGLNFGEEWISQIWFWIGLITFGVILLATYINIEWWGIGRGFGESWPAIVAGVIMIGMIIFLLQGEKIGAKK